jgi:D-glycero-D-manno-heptose 1,7-bisphosphate phosphatase
MADSAFFLDRDGVINRKAPDGDYIKSYEEFVFLPGAVEAIKILNESGYKVIVVTNQRGIALGLMSEADVDEIHKRMSLEIQNDGAHIDRIYYCPHEKDSCSCRKPDIGMFLKAKKDFPEVSFSSSFVVGDSSSDMEAGKSLNCKLIFVTKNASANLNTGYYEATSLYDAVKKYS